MSAKAFFFSLLIHSVLIALFFFKLQAYEKSIKEIVDIEFKYEVQKPVVKINNKIDVKLAGIKINKNNQEKSDLQLFPKMDPMSLLSSVEKNSLQKKVSGELNQSNIFNDSNTYSANINEVFGENGNQNWSYFKEIYKKIDSNLVFDSILAQYNHFGRVYVQFKVSDDGLFKMDELRADAEDPILKVHVLRAIKKSLNAKLENINKSKISSVTLFKAEINFSYGDYNNNFYKQNNFGKPVFVFNRATLEKPVPKELLEHLLSGGVTPNVSLMYERWQKYNKMKRLDAIDFDPFENYRRDVFYLM